MHVGMNVYTYMCIYVPWDNIPLYVHMYITCVRMCVYMYVCMYVCVCMCLLYATEIAEYMQILEKT
jgi:hypothetical protein